MLSPHWDIDSHWAHRRSRRNFKFHMRTFKSPDYETSVDPWSDTIAMVWPFPHIPRLFYSSLNPFKDRINCLFSNHKQTVYSVFKRILRAVKQARDVWKWSNHGNSVGPWVHCLVRDSSWQVLKHSQGEDYIRISLDDDPDQLKIS